MKRLVLLSTVLLLASCAQANAGYRITIRQAGVSHAAELQKAAVRVVERRAERLGQKLSAESVKASGSGAVMQFALQDPAVGEALTQELTAPFSFRVMVEAPREQADVWNEKGGMGFRETGVTEQHVTWVAATVSPDRTKGAAVILLTPEGQALLQKAFAGNQGKQMALFVRGVLMSRKKIGPEDQKASIQIDNIPSPAVASIFADDMNVGLHVTFQALPKANPK